MKRVVIFTDSKWRDLPGAIFTQINLSSLNDYYDIRIISYHLWKEVLELYSPHVAILNHAQGKRNNMIASQLRRNGGAAIVQFNEGILEFEDKEKIFAEQKGHPDIAGFLCWNNETANLVGGESIGCPRFDVYDKYKYIIDSKELFCNKFNLDPEKQIILWNDSWPSAKFTYQLQSFHRQNWNDLKNTVAKKWEDPDEFAQSQYQYQEMFKRYLLEAKYNFPDVQMILKSHPMSDYKMWDNWGRENDVVIVHGEYIYNALNAADLVITKLGSITVAEAWLLGKTAIKFGTDYYSASSKEQYDADPWNAGDLQALLSAIDFKLNFDEGVFSDSRNAYLRKWGILPSMASATTANILANFLDDAPHELRVQEKLTDFEKSIVAHDKYHSKNKLDSFGNWNKAVTQQDVKSLRDKIIQ